MPPYKPVVSTAQRGKLFALAKDPSSGVSMDDARGKAKAASALGGKLPRYKRKPQINDTRKVGAKLRGAGRSPSLPKTASPLPTTGRVAGRMKGRS